MKDIGSFRGGAGEVFSHLWLLASVKRKKRLTLIHLEHKPVTGKVVISHYSKDEIENLIANKGRILNGSFRGILQDVLATIKAGDKMFYFAVVIKTDRGSVGIFHPRFTKQIFVRECSRVYSKMVESVDGSV